jgi:hypothetical protein
MRAIAFFIFTLLLTFSLNNNFAFKHFSLVNQRKINTLTPSALAHKTAIAQNCIIENA